MLIEKDNSELPVEPDAWYDHQLVGLEVYRSGNLVGKITRVDHLPAQDLLVIESEGKEVLLPFVKAFVPSVDVKNNRLEITPPGGLFEELEVQDAN